MTSETENLPRIVIVCGPTGIGKTRLGIELSKRLGGEIVGADSMQVYRRMDIGTAKPTLSEQSEIPHHLIDVVDPDQSFSAADYARMADAAIANLHRRNLLPVVVGGTGLYIKALVYGLFEAPAAPPDIRRRLKAEAAERGVHRLFDRLKRLDPEAAAATHPNDSVRTLRALEVLEATGRPISEFRRSHGFASPRYSAFRIGLTLDRERLYDRIDRRVDLMIGEGLLEEVRELLDQGFSPSLKPMQSIGYRHMIDFIQERTGWEETVRLLKRDTRRYAKRQYTWFNADPEIRWIGPDGLEELMPALERFSAPPDP
ncbi:MAG: tRNA (adenosine(37)-N6)-dimethylallyltransferase MiaA [Desulfobacterales bacterium]